MKQKGSPKQVNLPDFWKFNENRVSEELKRMIYEQYLSNDTLTCYCDSSVNTEMRQMSVACTYVCSGRIIVKQQYVYPPPDCIDKPIFGELKALIFALNHFDKYMMHGCKNIDIYSDVDDVKGILYNQITFRSSESLKNVQSKIILLYKKMKSKHQDKTLDVRYLQTQQKLNNPFHKSSHNAARGILNKKLK